MNKIRLCKKGNKRKKYLNKIRKGTRHKENNQQENKKSQN